MLADIIIENVTSISFYHQIVNPETNKLSYAEEYSYTVNSEETEISETYYIDSLENTAEYLTSSSIILSNVNLSNLGTASDNRYYFAISQNANTNDDDVFANNNVEGSTHNNEDALNILENSMNNLKENQSTPSSEERIKAKSPETVEEELVQEETDEIFEEESVLNKTLEDSNENIEEKEIESVDEESASESPIKKEVTEESTVEFIEYKEDDEAV